MTIFNNPYRFEQLVKSWSKQVGLLCLMLGLGLAFSMQAQAAPTAGTIISNTATASYIDSSSTPQTITSNTVQTTVLAVGSFTLVSSQNFDVLPGDTKAILHTLTNTGNDTDAFNLVLNLTSVPASLNSIKIYADNGDGVFGAGDTELCSVGGATPCTGTNVTTGSLTPGSAFNFFVVEDVKSTAANGDSVTTIITASPVPASTITYSSPTATNTDVITVKLTAFTVTKSIQGTSSGVWNSTAATDITYRLAYENIGSQAGPLYLQDTIGSGSTVGFTYLTGTGLWSVGSAVLTDAAGETATGIHYDYNITAAGKVTVYIENVAAGATGYVEFHVKVANSSVAAGTSETTNTAIYGVPTNCSTGSCSSPTAPTTTSTTPPSAFTVVSINSFSLLKEQATASWGGSSCGAAGTYTTSGQNQTPGNCIWYRITATNNGTAAVTNVAITDIVPTNTTYAGTVGSPCTGTGSGSPSLTAPTVGSTGTVSCGTWSSLAAGGQTAILEFAVRINP